jgi:hypothetical protein
MKGRNTEKEEKKTMHHACICARTDKRRMEKRENE